MHRKKIRRWHKLLSVSGIIVAIFGMLYVPTANAQSSVPTVLGIYGYDYSSASTQTEYVDFESDVVGLEVSDFYFTGTATGCKVLNVPAVKAFSFSLQVGGCSEGSYFMNLKANSVAFDNGVTGPITDFTGDPTFINRAPLSGSFQNVPSQFDSTRMQWQFATNQRVAANPPYDFTVSGAGCFVAETGLVTTGMTIVVDGCKPGESVSLTINANALRSVYGNLGPVVAVTSPAVPIVIAQATSTPAPTPAPTTTQTPTPMPSNSPSASPTVSPTSSPTASPSASPSPSDTPASVAVSVPPTDPPSDPTPTVIQPEPIAPVVSDPPPTELIAEPALGLPPIAVTRSKIIAVRKAIALPVLTPQPIVETPPVVQVPVQPIAIPAIETETKPSLNWQPIGYLAISVGAATGAVGGGLLLQRMVRVRRLKFS